MLAAMEKYTMIKKNLLFMKLFPYKILMIDKKVFLDGVMVLGLGPSVSRFESFYCEHQ